MTTSPTTAPRDTDIAVVGIGARFPDADDLAAFRANLAAGRDSVGAMPAARAAATGLDPDAHRLPMGHLADVHTFDHAFFGLSRREAALMDPQHRIALVLAHRAVEDAGYPVDALRGHPVAVVLSAAASGYRAAAAEPGPLGALGNVPFALPARIAHVLGFTGPCYAVDTGCNGSLVAVHQACRELRDGEAAYALAGGFSLRPEGLPAPQTEGMTELVSPGGRCRAFDADADGTVSGEGGAVLLLTTLGRARADGAPVHAVIRGSAVRHNGRAAATISTPSAPAHAAVIGAAWRAAGLDPALAGYLETHGSGTRLGDAVELEGLGQVFGTRGFGGRGRRLPIGSVKTNIGHLDHAAGIAGLVKAVLAVGHGELYPSLHFRRPVDAAALDPVEVVTELRPWEGAERIAGVSSYSLAGINAHCVVQRPPAPAPAAPRRAEGPRPARLVAVSARSRPALAALCADLGAALAGPAAGADLDDVAHTLNSGRAHHRYRIAVAARDTAGLARALADRAPGPGEPVADAAPGGRGGPPAVCLLLSPDAAPVAPGPAPLPVDLPATGRLEADLLAGQLALHRALLAAGVPVETVLSSGVSRYAARHLLGTLTAADTRELAAGVEAPPPDRDRLVAAAERLTAAGPVVFVDPGPGGVLGRLLAERFGPHGQDGARLVTVPAEAAGAGTAADGFEALLGRLYEAGVELDWAALGPAPGTARRLRLPGHPLAATPCWLRPPAAPAALVPSAAAAAPATAVAPAPVERPEDPQPWLAGVLAELLHSEQPLGPADHYFELGGNSIIALQLADRVEARFGFRPKLLDVYEHPEVGALAALIRARAGRPSAPALPPVVPRGAAVTSFGQDRIWFHHQLDPDTTLYNLPMVSRISGPLDVDAVRGMWHDLMLRHEVLRSNFVEEDDQPVLRLRPEPGDFFAFRDVSGEPDPQAAARELVRRAAGHRFDLAHDPLVRVLVIRTAPEEHVLQVTMHHAVNDGASPRIFARELPELHAARREGRPHRLAPLPVQFADYAAWQRDLVAGPALDGELAYWREKLRDAPVLRLPTDHPRPARKDYAGELAVFTLDAELMRELRRLAAEHSATLFVVLLAGLYLLLARHSEQDDLVVGTPTTGRNRPELEGLIGFFNSTVALRADLSGDPSVAGFLRRVRTVVLEALEHQEIPFDKVVQALTAERDPGRSPLFDVFFVHQELPPIQRIEGTSTGYFDTGHTRANLFGGLPGGTAKFDLTLITSDRAGDDAMTACLEFSTQLFTPATAAAFAAEYTALLGELVAADGTAPLAGLWAPAPGAAQAPGEPAPRGPVPSGPVRLDVPTDRPRPGSPVAAARAATTPVDQPLREAVEAFGTDPERVLRAGWLVLLSWISGEDEVAVGLPGGTLLRADLSDEPGFAALVERTATAAVAAPGAEPTVRSRGDGRDSGEFGGSDQDGPDQDGPATQGPGPAELDLAWRPGPGGGPTALTVHYAPELFDPSTAAGFATALRELLRGLLAEPDRPVHDVAAEHADPEPGPDPAGTRPTAAAPPQTDAARRDAR
ncbi:condensation domain-containing protein [Kitasatospora sp. NPDC101176]|uniref:condensation domain-containing protein n=1 Tax=Kitasatospora sp. NPDC101176 TaxID=3364099 RepID=UPI00382BE671